eukprot:5734093-Pyramimonas_sp.AAC.1
MNTPEEGRTSYVIRRVQPFARASSGACSPLHVRVAQPLNVLFKRTVSCPAAQHFELIGRHKISTYEPKEDFRVSREAEEEDLHDVQRCDDMTWDEMFWDK